MEEESLLKQLHESELSLGLYSDTIKGVPIWRLLRHFTRIHYLNKQTGFVGGSTTVRIGTPRPKLFSGFWKFVGKKELNVFFPFGRLACIDGEYLDRFIDPLISQSDIEDGNFFIIDPPNYIGNYKRLHKSNTVSNEGRTVFRQVLKYWFKITTPILYGKKIRRLFNNCKEDFLLDKKCMSFYNNTIANFLATYTYYLIWFSLLKPRRVFVVFREQYFPQIAACKHLGISVAEFQHGITMGDTVSFTGEYDPRIDPDYFLVFGEFWKGPQFGMPLNKIFCVGWAYKNLIEKKIGVSVSQKENRILVISSPEITDSIINTLAELSKTKGEYGFDIRLHPCESLSVEQGKKLKLVFKAQVVDNKIDSAVVLPSYKYVIGENSSVLYEALSVGCKVGMLKMCGLNPVIDRPGIKENFFVINNCEDFKNFMQEESQQSKPETGFYSDFDNKTFMEFINKSM